ncbi:ParB/RepB/Spo0J family partition protein [Actinoplanes subglobosus]|uniref:ParB/RepB/Spo0J family partition protein n=1 Tax=Actinoplanes subglobosus TaxID=1547892 RepID=A0ABV8IRX5_9ACTN
MSTETSTATPVERDSEFVRADPRELIVGANVRLDPRLDKGFIASVRERGVLQAITAYRDDEQRLIVLYGQRRTVAAVEVGLPTVPVMVVARPDEVDRLGDQVIENDRRAALTVGERVTAFEQMAAFGLSAAQIAKRTGNQGKDDVATALTVAKSPLAKGAAQRYDFLDLQQAAVVAEFADDKDAVTRLIGAAKAGQGFGHLAQRLRDDRAEQQAKADKTAELAAAGLAIVDQPEHADPKVRELYRLVDADEQKLDEANHRECPGHAAFVKRDWYRVEITDEAPEPEDDDHEDEEDAEGESGGRTREVFGWTPKFVCTDYTAHGHQERFRATGTSGQPKVAEMTDQERETKRAERRDVIQSNKDWGSATTVRREWLATFLTRKTLPKGAAVFLAAGLARPDMDLARAYDLAYGLLKLDGKRPSWQYGQDAFTVLVGKATEARAQVLALALVVAAFEFPLKERNSWRGADANTVRYLRFLQTCGYELAAIERRACGEPAPVADQDTSDPDSQD